jgi:hypothetical protein
MFNVKYRGGSYDEVEAMTFSRLAFWNDYHLLLERREKQAATK